MSESLAAQCITASQHADGDIAAIAQAMIQAQQMRDARILEEKEKSSMKNAAMVLKGIAARSGSGDDLSTGVPKQEGKRCVWDSSPIKTSSTGLTGTCSPPPPPPPSVSSPLSLSLLSLSLSLSSPLLSSPLLSLPACLGDRAIAETCPMFYTFLSIFLVAFLPNSFMPGNRCRPLTSAYRHNARPCERPHG